MSKRLSICIPTYNREDEVLAMLTFICDELNALKSEQRDNCEVIVRDNCSTDNTEQLIKKYSINKPFITYCRNDINIGGDSNMRKISYDATGDYVWWVGDDDEMKHGIIKAILDSVEDYNPAMIFINHRGVKDKERSVIFFSSAVSEDSPIYYEDGKQAISDIVSYSSIGTVLFMSAKVIRRDYLIESFKYTDPTDNSNPLFSALYAATKGSAAIIKDAMIDNIYGEVRWKSEAKYIHFKLIPDAIYKIRNLGYTQDQIKNIEDSYFTKERIRQIRLYHLERKHPKLYSFLRSVKHVFK